LLPLFMTHSHQALVSREPDARSGGSIGRTVTILSAANQRCPYSVKT
jgi:hypothetical protein